MKFEFLGRDGFWLFAAIKKEYFQKLTQFHFIKHLRLTETKKKKKKKAKAIIGGDHNFPDFNFYDFYWHSLLIVYFLFYFFYLHRFETWWSTEGIWSRNWLHSNEWKRSKRYFQVTAVNIKRLLNQVASQFSINKDVNYISHQPSIVLLKLNSSKNSLLYTRCSVPKRNESFPSFQTLHVINYIVLGGI